MQSSTILCDDILLHITFRRIRVHEEQIITINMEAALISERNRHGLCFFMHAFTF